MATYRTVITVIVLSQEPIDYVNDLIDVGRELRDGPWLGDWTTSTSERLSKDEAAEVLSDYGTEPQYFEGM